MKGKNPYQTPESNLIHESVPNSFYIENASAGQLNLAGWLSILYAAITVPTLILSFSGIVSEDDNFEIASHALEFLSTFLWIYLLLALKKFIELRFQLKSLTAYVDSLIVITLLLMAFGFLLDQDPEAISVGMIMYFGLIVVYAVISFLLGRKLLSIKEEYPYIRAFSWTIMISGVCMATIILLLLAIPIGIASDILLALLFFKGRKELDMYA